MPSENKFRARGIGAREKMVSRCRLQTSLAFQ